MRTREHPNPRGDCSGHVVQSQEKIPTRYRRPAALDVGSPRPSGGHRGNHRSRRTLVQETRNLTGKDRRFHATAAAGSDGDRHLACQKPGRRRRPASRKWGDWSIQGEAGDSSTPILPAFRGYGTRWNTSFTPRTSESARCVFFHAFGPITWRWSSSSRCGISGRLFQLGRHRESRLCYRHSDPQTALS